MPASVGATARFAFAGAEPSSAFAALGTEPPLTVGSRDVGVPARRAVSVRWLSGTVLTGFTALILMGGALNVALNSRQLAVLPPEAADLGFLAANVTTGEKGDRILPVAAPPTTREIIPVTVTVREDDRELFQLRDYAFVNATLAAANAEGIEVPAYDPVRIVGEAANNEPEEVRPPTTREIAEGDVNGGNAAVRTMPFPMEAAFEAGPPIDTNDIAAIVAANAAFFDAGADMWSTILAYATANGFGYELGAANGLGIGTAGFRAIPENVGYLAKAPQGDASRNERLVPFASGVTLPELLANAGVAQAEIDQTVGVMDTLIDLGTLSTEHQARIAFAPNGAPDTEPALLRVSIYANGTHQATVARDDEGNFVRADEPGPMPESATSTGRVVTGALPRLYEALYLTAVEQGVPDDQVNDLIRIFAFELDMLATVGPNDTVSLFHGIQGSDDDGILYASVTIGGTTTAYYRFQTEDGVINYYDANGASADNFLLRKPMSGGEFRSGYGNRLHPILGVYRLHAGVDWSAPRGTPIVAAGDGVIERMEWNSGGYGRYTVIQHANGYETTYAHQSAFAEGLQEGDRVRQGQVIGYVGSTGLSTGNHLHYEVRINGQTVNPLTIRLPEGRVLTGAELVAFQAARDQINELLGITVEDTQVAAAN